LFLRRYGRDVKLHRAWGSRMPKASCQGCGNPTENTLCCPRCAEFGRTSFFCSQDCFTHNWQAHCRLHALLDKQRKQATQEKVQEASAAARSGASAGLAARRGADTKSGSLPLPATSREREKPAKGQAASGGGVSIRSAFIIVVVLAVGLLWFSSRYTSVQPEGDTEAGEVSTFVARSAAVPDDPSGAQALAALRAEIADLHNLLDTHEQKLQHVLSHFVEKPQETPKATVPEDALAVAAEAHKAPVEEGVPVEQERQRAPPKGRKKRSGDALDEAQEETANFIP